jgi:hypothetical protein
MNIQEFKSLTPMDTLFTNNHVIKNKIEINITLKHGRFLILQKLLVLGSRICAYQDQWKSFIDLMFTDSNEI